MNNSGLTKVISQRSVYVRVQQSPIDIINSLFSAVVYCNFTGHILPLYNESRLKLLKKMFYLSVLFGQINAIVHPHDDGLDAINGSQCFLFSPERLSAAAQTSLFLADICHQVENTRDSREKSNQNSINKKT